MNVLLLLAGVADPKWPLPAEVDATTLAAHRAAHPLLSPFDEAALELALKLRDGDPALRITALLSASSRDDPLLRHLAGFRLDAVAGFSLERWPAWRAPALAAALASYLNAQAQRPDLILIGREFGDLDDGSLPAALGEALALPLTSLVLALAAQHEELSALRQQGAALEQLPLALPAMASVSNHSRNRLRHPLLKNVMMARKASFEMIDLPDPPATADLHLRGLDAAATPPRATSCRMLGGDAAAQARALAALLRTAGETA